MQITTLGLDLARNVFHAPSAADVMLDNAVLKDLLGKP